MSDHSTFVALAERLIAKHGRTVQIRSVTKTGPAYDPYQTATDTPVKAVQVSHTKDDRDQGLVTKTSKAFLIDAQTEITTAMSIVDGAVYSITSIDKLQPGDQVIRYRITVDG